MPDVTMPRLSDTMQEGTIARWLKKPGDAVKRGDVLAQIETDKATMDLEAYENGTLQEIVANEGATVPIGETIARIGAGGASASAPAPQQSAPGTETAAPPAADATGSVKPESPAARENVAEAPEPTATPRENAGTLAGTSASGQTREASVAPAGRTDGAPPAADGTVRASPLARRIAEEHGIDLRSLRGSGPEGRVIRADVEAALASGGRGAQPSKGAAAPEAGAEDERVPLSQMRKTIARRMAESTRTVPHFFLTSVVDVTELVSLRKQLNAQLEAAGEADAKVSINDFITRAVALALRRVPELNVSFAEDALIKRGRVHVGQAVALEGGLVVPVIRDADTKGVKQLSRETRELAEKARTGKLRPEEYTGGTFSVSNLGMFGVEQFNAVINPPEAGILAVGAVAREPAEYQGQIALRDRLRLTLSVDHRAANGADGARFLQQVKLLLEQPLLLLA